MIDLPDGSFLMPNATALVEAGVFLVVLIVVSKWVMPRLQSALNERQRRIDEQLDAAAAATAAAGSREKRAEELLRQARLDARLIIDRAYEQRDHLVAEGMRRGQEEYDWFTRSRPAAHESAAVRRTPRAPHRSAHASRRSPAHSVRPAPPPIGS